MADIKKCSVCGRVMTDAECGAEFPEERVCDACAGIVSDSELVALSGLWKRAMVEARLNALHARTLLSAMRKTEFPDTADVSLVFNGDGTVRRLERVNGLPRATGVNYGEPFTAA